MKRFWIIVATVALSPLNFGCGTTNAEAYETAQGVGLTEVQLGSLSMTPGLCAEDDKIGRLVTAKNPYGQTVSGVVCCRYFGSCTIRFR